MLWGTILTSVFAGLGGLLLYFYYWKRGQFERHEDVKYQILRQNEHEPLSKEESE